MAIELTLLLDQGVGLTDLAKGAVGADAHLKPEDFDRMRLRSIIKAMELRQGLPSLQRSCRMLLLMSVTRLSLEPHWTASRCTRPKSALLFPVADFFLLWIDLLFHPSRTWQLPQ
jgi:hypothetical protein